VICKFGSNPEFPMIWNDSDIETAYRWPMCKISCSLHTIFCAFASVMTQQAATI